MVTKINLMKKLRLIQQKEKGNMVGNRISKRKSKPSFVVKSLKSYVKTSLLTQNEIWTFNHNKEQFCIKIH